METFKKLDDVFSYLSVDENYKAAVKTRIIKIILGVSVIRVFKEGSKIKLQSCLEKIDVDSLLSLQSQEEFNKWHTTALNKIYSCLKKEPVNIKRLSEEGLKWGHSTKILNLFVGHLFMMSPYFEKDENYHRVKYFLHVPLDSKVFDVLKECNISSVPKNIKSVDSKTYKKLQRVLKEAARSKDLPVLYFDEYAWAMED